MKVVQGLQMILTCPTALCIIITRTPVQRLTVDLVVAGSTPTSTTGHPRGRCQGKRCRPSRSRRTIL